MHALLILASAAQLMGVMVMGDLTTTRRFGICEVPQGPLSGKDVPEGEKHSNMMPETVAVRGHYPYHALIQTNEGDIYSGALITKNAIVTSARSIVSSMSWHVYLGTVMLGKSDPGTWSVVSVSAKPHPLYNQTGRMEHDVGVIYLPSVPATNSFIHPVSLPDDLIEGNSYDGITGDVSGWGVTVCQTNCATQLHWDEQRVVPAETCIDFYAPDFATNNTLCAVKPVAGSCFGDSGSPLVARINGATKLIGLLSYVSGHGCSTDLPAGYTTVAAYKNWIVATAAAPIFFG